MAKTIMIAANDPNLIYLLQRYAEESGFRDCQDWLGRGHVLDQRAQDTKPAVDYLGNRACPGSMGLGHPAPAQSRTRQRTIFPSRFTPGLTRKSARPGEGVDGYLQKSVLYDDFVAAFKHAGVHVLRKEPMEEQTTARPSLRFLGGQ